MPLVYLRPPINLASWRRLFLSFLVNDPGSETPKALFRRRGAGPNRQVFPSAE